MFEFFNDTSVVLCLVRACRESWMKSITGMHETESDLEPRGSMVYRLPVPAPESIFILYNSSNKILSEGNVYSLILSSFLR